MKKLTKAEAKEPINITIGRVQSIAKMNHDDRLLALINKIARDIEKEGII